MAATQHVTLAAPLTACEVFQLLLEADKYPCTGNEDVPVAVAMTRDALEKVGMAVLSPDDPPEFARWAVPVEPGLVEFLKAEDFPFTLQASGT